MEDFAAMDDERLAALARQIGALLKERRCQKARFRQAPSRTPGEGGRWLRFEYTNCGKCARCTAGLYVHGPYWYLYVYSGGKMRSTYLGRRMPEEAARAHGVPGLAGRRPEDVYPTEVANSRGAAG